MHARLVSKLWSHQPNAPLDGLSTEKMYMLVAPLCFSKGVIKMMKCSVKNTKTLAV